MLDLTEQLADLLQARLNHRETLTAWQVVLDSDEFARHTELEADHYDTTFSEFHHDAGRFFSRQLADLRSSLGESRPAGYLLLGRWLDCEDVFALSAAGPHVSDWVRAHVRKRPLTAFRVGCTVFYLSGKGRPTWRRRAWAGSQTDPLMTLPYQRKYDDERHVRADERLRDRYERVNIAYDLLTLVGERIQDADTRDGFAWPEIAGVQTELGQLGLGFGIDSLSAFFGVTLELFALRCAPTPQRDRIDFSVEEGRYGGELGGYHRRRSGARRPSPSPAALKWMCTSALNDLRARLRDIADGGGCRDAEKAPTA